MAAAVEYIPKESPVHRLTAVTKIFWTLFILASGLLFNDCRYLLALLCSVLLVAALAGVLRSLLPAVGWLSIFALFLLLIQALFYNRGEVLFYLIPSGNYLPVTDLGLLSGVAMAFRMMAMVLSFLVFLATTRTQDIILTLVEKFRMPYDYALMFTTALRFIPTFLGEIRQVSEAQQARGHTVEGFNPVKKIKAYAPVTVPLVLISLNKAEKLAMAMETRGYGGKRRTCFRKLEMRPADYCLTAILAVLLAVCAAARAAGYGTM
ncbi:MAG: energy-coupling factor transporter transmembrane protein EcfT [Pelotomaculum sp.]|uniref:ABC-type cobalt transport system, permease component CbiQ and related transporters n=1 Tax=Pelotomaculum thermopropionicum (strain DSM 13744 / JCM 10971 / SI) TaxID=370438 RepID=A5D1N8_PELTS|nr:energy-coupling factor transporter transmembrane protein EcfT [Pelotomaculum sp.]BAF59840.1 ABC-type cobalt transport system, permease component CbiQ and related transporters [Pelotomaculum thermopropionicum SI]